MQVNTPRDEYVLEMNMEMEIPFVHALFLWFIKIE